MKTRFSFSNEKGKQFAAGIGLDITERKKMEDALKRYTQRLISLEEELRKNIAHDLHDQVGQELTALTFNLHYILKGFVGNGNLEDLLVSSIELSKSINRTVRKMMVMLHPHELENLGLATAIISHVRKYEERSGIATDVIATDPFPRLNLKRELALFRVVQESLHNTEKHAEASCAHIDLEYDAPWIRLAIRDDGKGFPQDRLPGDAQSGWGLGIMRERIESLGGSFVITSVPGMGTSIRAEIRMDTSEADAHGDGRAQATSSPVH